MGGDRTHHDSGFLDKSRGINDKRRHKRSRRSKNRRRRLNKRLHRANNNNSANNINQGRTNDIGSGGGSKDYNKSSSTWEHDRYNAGGENGSYSNNRQERGSTKRHKSYNRG